MKIREDRKQYVKPAAWLNLFLGLYNLMLFSRYDSWFNFIIGALNVGVWVFFRKVK